MQEDNKLTKFIEEKLPDYFTQLPEEDRRRALNKIFDSNNDLMKMKSDKLIKSYIASLDLNKLLDVVSELESKNKIYSVDQAAETGSGKINVHIKGGDTKFIVPIIIVLGIILLGILFIVFKK